MKIKYLDILPRTFNLTDDQCRTLWDHPHNSVYYTRFEHVYTSPDGKTNCYSSEHVRSHNDVIKHSKKFNPTYYDDSFQYVSTDVHILISGDYMVVGSFYCHEFAMTDPRNLVQSSLHKLNF